MPIWLRKFTWSKIVDHHNGEAERAKEKNNSDSNIDLSKPYKGNTPKRTISPPSYVTSSSRKK